MTTTAEASPSTRATATTPSLLGVQHLGLTVRDVVASEAWYSSVLGLVRAFVEPHSVGDGHAVVMTCPGTGLFLGLDHHSDADLEMFNPRRTGLDHLAFRVANRDDMDIWIAHLDAMGVDHDALIERPEPVPHSLVVLRDPDEIAIELFWLADMTSQPQLPQRAGSRPTTTSEIPHSQLDQQPGDSRYVDAILAEASTWPSVVEGPSTISVEGARALMLDESVTPGPREGVMVGREFCHVHAQGDFSLHAALPLSLAAAAESAGWAEPHFFVRTGQAPANIVMIYAPRDSAERDVVLGLVRASYEFALNPGSAE
jgi:glyoxylase I family protein